MTLPLGGEVCKKQMSHKGPPRKTVSQVTWRMWVLTLQPSVHILGALRCVPFLPTGPRAPLGTPVAWPQSPHYPHKAHAPGSLRRHCHVLAGPPSWVAGPLEAPALICSPRCPSGQQGARLGLHRAGWRQPGPQSPEGSRGHPSRERQSLSTTYINARLQWHHPSAAPSQPRPGLLPGSVPSYPGPMWGTSQGLGMPPMGTLDLPWQREAP